MIYVIIQSYSVFYYLLYFSNYTLKLYFIYVLLNLSFIIIQKFTTVTLLYVTVVNLVS